MLMEFEVYAEGEVYGSNYFTEFYWGWQNHPFVVRTMEWKMDAAVTFPTGPNVSLGGKNGAMVANIINNKHWAVLDYVRVLVLQMCAAIEDNWIGESVDEWICTIVVDGNYSPKSTYNALRNRRDEVPWSQAI